MRCKNAWTWIPCTHLADIVATVILRRLETRDKRQSSGAQHRDASSGQGHHCVHHLPGASLLAGSFQGRSPLCAGSRGRGGPRARPHPAPRQPSWCPPRGGRGTRPRGRRGGARAGVGAATPFRAGHPLHRRAPRAARGRSGCRRRGAAAAGRQAGSPGAGTPRPGESGRLCDFPAGCAGVARQPPAGARPSSSPRPPARLPARVPPTAPRPPAHRYPRAAARAALRTCSAPPPPPPEEPLPPRRPRAPPPPAARPRSASPCAATRPGGPDALSLSLRSGRSLRPIQGRKRGARALASGTPKSVLAAVRGSAPASASVSILASRRPPPLLDHFPVTSIFLLIFSFSW